MSNLCISKYLANFFCYKFKKVKDKDKKKKRNIYLSEKNKRVSTKMRKENEWKTKLRDF